MTDEEVKQLLDRRISLVLSVSLYSSSLRACFLQTAFSVETNLLGAQSLTADDVFPISSCFHVARSLFHQNNYF